ncbi:MAG: fumarylacetoacetase [Actinobacteria bacterium]|nr:fumarylacetoacetase [Actinomycetota bacterium]
MSARAKSQQHGFGIDHLPYGVVQPRGGGDARCVARIGDEAIDLGGLDLSVDPATFSGGTLNRFCAAGPAAWESVREELQRRIEDDEAMPKMALADVEVLLPLDIGDYVDFYSSLHHATNLGRLFRPDSEPLLPNWRRLPIGYHGRSGTVAVSGTPVRRPVGLVKDGESIVRRPSATLDIELEVGFIVGHEIPAGACPGPDEAAEHVFGVVLVNDWSARDIQAFEYQPLGPFLGKSFLTTMSGWITPMAALESWLVHPPVQEPAPAGHLRASRPWGLDLDLSVELNGATISSTNFADLYWTFAQQLAHLTSNGASARPGDLFASGTVSGEEPGTYGSLIELTWRGRDPIELPDGTQRRFLEDGDSVILRGGAGSSGSGPTLELGAAEGTIRPA